MIRADSLKSQVRQCLHFCTADFLSWLAYESAEPKIQTLPNLRLSISSVNDICGLVHLQIEDAGSQKDSLSIVGIPQLPRLIQLRSHRAQTD